MPDDLTPEATKTRRVECRGCGGTGRWETECCNGSDGCTCRGEVLDMMGACRACGGSGIYSGSGPNDGSANRDAIRGLHFIGSGPTGMHDIWPNRGNLR